jgi:hypothetical protein
MNRHLAAALALLVLFGYAYCSRESKAATPLPPAPAHGYCYDSFITPNYNGVRECPGTTPPPVDPGAYQTLSVTWLGDDRAPHTIDVTRCENLWGRMNFAQPIIGWPYKTATVKWSKQDARYLRCRIRMPANPGTLSHAFKVVSYGTTIPVRMALVSPGAPWPTGTVRTACFVPVAVNDQPAIHVNPGAPNSSKCSLGANAEGDLLVDAGAGQRGSISVANY